MSAWKRCSEEMPPMGERVIGYPADDIAVVCWRRVFGKVVWEDDYGTEMWPTHWQQLPEPPEEGE